MLTRLPAFVAELFHGLQPRMFPPRIAAVPRKGEEEPAQQQPEHVQMALAAVDIMLGAPVANDCLLNEASGRCERGGEAGGQLWLLEVNGRNPGCPAEGTMSDSFVGHLQRLVRGISTLALELPPCAGDEADDSDVEGLLRNSGFSHI